MIELQEKEALQQSLITWFQSHRREMPWRESANPYFIWISEIMLQQTQVVTVVPYFERFIRQFPTVHDLAEVDSHQVMKAWEGLGYYSRARNMHGAAREIVTRFHGTVPDNLEALLSLPGIGRYTAGAILSIAYGIKAPILDGNVIRVLTRVFHITDNVDKTATKTILWDFATSILPDEKLRDFNEGLMELGATVCTPASPDCPHCPWQAHCEAFRLGIQEELPFKTPKKPVPHLDVTAGVIWKDDQFLITLRPPKGLLGGLWEFPGGKVEEGETLEACLRREIDEELAIRVRVGKKLIAVNHAYTHFKITLHVFECDFESGILEPRACDDFRWITAEQLGDFAFPGADRKVIAAIRKEHLA